jgi:hypothetical protein
LKICWTWGIRTPPSSNPMDGTSLTRCFWMIVGYLVFPSFWNRHSSIEWNKNFSEARTFICLAAVEMSALVTITYWVIIIWRSKMGQCVTCVQADLLLMDHLYNTLFLKIRLDVNRTELYSISNLIQLFLFLHQ